MANPILVTGAAGRVGGIGRTVTELLLKTMTDTQRLMSPQRTDGRGNGSLFGLSHPN